MRLTTLAPAFFWVRTKLLRSHSTQLPLVPETLALARALADACGRVFHVVSNPPAPGDRCIDGGPHDLFQRPDDNESTVRERLAVYRERTLPRIDYYARKGLLRRIDADGSLDEVDARLESAL